MRRCRAALSALLLAVCSLLVAGPASAGGPTSALLVVPGTGSTASLYASDADYGELARLVGAFEADGAAGRIDRSGAGHEFGTGVTVTWLIHDVQVWRVDRVYVGARGGPWISTRTAVGGTGSIWDSPVVWHTASDGKALTVLVDRLGLGSAPLDDATDATDAADAAGTAAGVAPADRPTERSQPARADASWPGWVWGLGGVALGFAVGLAAVRFATTSRGMIRPARIILEEDHAWSTAESTQPASPGALSSRSTP